MRFGSDRAPLELIAHVVENDLPYTEILTADYIMANPWAATAYGASTRFDDPEDMHEFQPSEIVSYYRQGEGYDYECDPVVGACRILNPGPLITDYPHAGILNTTVFLLRYPTTATNRNRARSRWTYYHFLGLDIEKSASRTTDPDALADTNNPTMFNSACTVCHRVLDPVAGAFQNYFDEGQYKSNWGGIDSLDEFYTRGPDDRKDGDFLVTASSWERRHTFSKTATLTKNDASVRLSTSPDFPADAERRSVVERRLRGASDHPGRRGKLREAPGIREPRRMWRLEQRGWSACLRDIFRVWGHDSSGSSGSRGVPDRGGDMDRGSP